MFLISNLLLSMFQYNSIFIFIFIIILPILVINIIVNNPNEHFNETANFKKNINNQNRKIIIQNETPSNPRKFLSPDDTILNCKNGYKIDSNIIKNESNIPYYAKPGIGCKGGKFLTNEYGTECACTSDETKIINAKKVTAKDRLYLGNQYITEYDLKRAIENLNGFKDEIKSKLIFNDVSDKQTVNNDFTEINQNHLENFSNLWPEGAIINFRGLIKDIPDGWVLCDGNNGTPDLTDKFIKGFDDTPKQPPPPPPPRGKCNIGYEQRTFEPNDPNYPYWWACGEGCEGGKYWTDIYCNCACKKFDPSPPPNGYNYYTLTQDDIPTKSDEHFQTNPEPIDKRPPFYPLLYIMRTDTGSNLTVVRKFDPDDTINESDSISDGQKVDILRRQIKSYEETPVG
jgi:hypothetical protein